MERPTATIRHVVARSQPTRENNKNLCRQGYLFKKRSQNFLTSHSRGWKEQLLGEERPEKLFHRFRRNPEVHSFLAFIACFHYLHSFAKNMIFSLKIDPNISTLWRYLDIKNPEESIYTDS